MTPLSSCLLRVSNIGFGMDNVMSPFVFEQILTQRHTKNFIKNNMQHSVKLLKSEVTFMPHVQNSTWSLLVLFRIKGRHPAFERSYCLLHLDPFPKRKSHNVNQICSKLKKYLCRSEMRVYPDENPCVTGKNFQISKCCGETQCFVACWIFLMLNKLQFLFAHLHLSRHLMFANFTGT